VTQCMLLQPTVARPGGLWGLVVITAGSLVDL